MTVVDLTPEEQRVLGCLIEKEAFTPDAYPLTLNSLVLACNQSSNRDPIVASDETTALEALQQLRERGLVRVVHSSSYRATKYRHIAGELWGLTSGELAVIAVLLLRGPQTLNELRTRTERYGGDLRDLGGVEVVLDRLATGKEEPFVQRSERQPGQREERWLHLLGPVPSPDLGPALGPGAEAPLHSVASRTETTRSVSVSEPPLVAETDSLTDLARQVANLRDEISQLRNELSDLRQQFAKGSELGTSGYS
jgi:uncharacterized protein YceH (UPF0502 family)